MNKINNIEDELFNVENFNYLNTINPQMRKDFIKSVLYERALIKNDFKKSINNLLSISGYNKSQISNALGINKSYISNIFNGKKKASIISIILFCKFIDASSNITYELLKYNDTTIKTQSSIDILYRAIINNSNLKNCEHIKKIIEEFNIKKHQFV